jgi:BlaI family transcriptional regulator, penicillinase repressor
MRNTEKSTGRNLSELQNRVMQVLWSLGAVTSEQVRDSLGSRNPLKDSTVRTILRRLEAKGYVRHRVEGRTYIYSGVEAPRNVAVQAVRQIIDRFCGGSVEQLLVGMVENEVLDRGELRSLAQRIAEGRDATGEKR